MTRLLGGLALLGAVGAGPVAAQGTRNWRPEERVIVSDFTVVRALAAGETRVYVAARGGLGIYDLRFRQWEPPVSTLDGYPRETVRAALADPTEDAVWLATDAGLARYRPQIRQWDVVLVAGGVQDLMFDRDDPFRGLFLRTRSGWERLPPGGVIPSPARDLPPPARQVRPLSVDRAMARYPQIDAMRADALIDEQLRTFRYTAAARAPRSEELWLGTDGLGVILYDAGIVRFERRPFGLVAAGAGAVVTVPGGVWAGSDHRAGRPGFSFVDERLQRYQWEEGRVVSPFRFGGVRDLLGRGREIWAATDRGVIRFGADGAGARELTVHDGLPDDDTYALAQGPAGVWIGTAFGLALARDDGTVERIGARVPTPVLALAAARDSVWVGSTAGLGRAWAGGSRVVVPPDVAAVPEFRTAVVALALAGDTLTVASVDRIVWGVSGRWHVERVLSADLGPIFAVAHDDGRVWIGGERGIGYFRFADRAFFVTARQGDLPGPVRDLAVAGEYLWVATEGGVVRFRRSALTP